MKYSGNSFRCSINNTVRMAAIISFGELQDKMKIPKFIENCTRSSLYEQLTHMIDVGEINEAENELLDAIDANEKSDLEMELGIYDYMNDKEDSFLEQYDYTREEIEDGIKSVMVLFGYIHLII